MADGTVHRLIHRDRSGGGLIARGRAHIRRQWLPKWATICRGLPYPYEIVNRNGLLSELYSLSWVG